MTSNEEKFKIINEMLNRKEVGLFLTCFYIFLNTVYVVIYYIAASDPSGINSEYHCVFETGDLTPNPNPTWKGQTL